MRLGEDLQEIAPSSCRLRTSWHLTYIYTQNSSIHIKKTKQKNRFLLSLEDKLSTSFFDTMRGLQIWKIGKNKISRCTHIKFLKKNEKYTVSKYTHYLHPSSGNIDMDIHEYIYIIIIYIRIRIPLQLYLYAYAFIPTERIWWAQFSAEIFFFIYFPIKQRILLSNMHGNSLSVRLKYSLLNITQPDWFQNKFRQIYL